MSSDKNITLTLYEANIEYGYGLLHPRVQSLPTVLPKFKKKISMLRTFIFQDFAPQSVTKALIFIAFKTHFVTFAPQIFAHPHP